ncbi:MAG: prolipoprotein diacylglyceryl transferase [Candidatus Omnitrophica bacterium]|nr:prolipoprotein diacylglyceryl transferase [Candidatus Omnitrophota bacterium]
MHPEVCTIGPFTIYSYGLMLALAFVVGQYLASRQARKEKFNPEAVFNFLFLSVISGIAGARIFYVLENLRYYLGDPLEIIMFQHGGLSWFGGLILGACCGLLYLKRKGMPIYRVLDLVAPFIALSQAIGRIGCLLNGCCYGKAAEWGFWFPEKGEFLIPTQVCSSLALILIFFALRFMQERPHKNGEIFFAYLLLYSLKRFFIEFWRGDNPVVLRGMTLFQILSVIVFFLALTKLVIIKKKNG